MTIITTLLYKKKNKEFHDAPTEERFNLLLIINRLLQYPNSTSTTLPTIIQLWPKWWSGNAQSWRKDLLIKHWHCFHNCTKWSASSRSFSHVPVVLKQIQKSYVVMQSSSIEIQITYLRNEADGLDTAYISASSFLPKDSKVLFASYTLNQ